MSLLFNVGHIVSNLAALDHAVPGLLMYQSIVCAEDDIRNPLDWELRGCTGSSGKEN